MKFWLRSLSGAALALLSAAIAHATAQLAVTGATGATAAPGDTVIFSVTIANNALTPTTGSTTANDYAGGTLDLTIRLTSNTASTIELGTKSIVVPPLASGGSSTNVTSSRQIPLSYSQAGNYTINASIEFPPTTRSTASAAISGTVTSVNLSTLGSGYTSAPTVSFTGGGGTGAAGTAVIAGGAVVAIHITNPGTGYSTAPAVSLSGGGGSGATATSVMTGTVSSVTFGTAGTGYISAPSVVFTGGAGGNGAAATISPTGSVTAFAITSGGSGYTSAPSVAVSAPGGGGTTATGSATVSLGVTTLTVTGAGSGYSTTPTVTIAAPGGTGATATATATLNSGISAINITAGGTGYSATPTVAITGGGGSGATASATVAGGAITSITVTANGTGYTSTPTVTITDTTGTGATATATFGTISALTITSAGSGYASAPAVTIAAPGGGGAQATATSAISGTVTTITVGTGGTNYSSSPTVTISGGGGSGANAIATLTYSAATSSISSNGSNYTSAPTVTLSGGGSGGSDTITTGASAPFATTTATQTITGKPDLQITSLNYPAGIAYRGGDVIPMSLTFVNRTSTNSSANVPFVASTTATMFRIQVVISNNPTYGDADDFLLTFLDVSSTVNADSVAHTLSWNQLLPGNYSGSYYVLAKIDQLSAVDETVESDPTSNGNNVWLDVNATRLALLPTTFPTVSLASTTGSASGNGYSDNPSITSDGRYVTFASDASNLVSGDTNAARDIFLFDSQNATVRRLNLSQQGAQTNGNSNTPAISADGRYVAFASDATNLILGDTNAFTDIFVVDTITGAIARESISTAGAQANGSSFRPALSSDGRYLVFESSATNLIGAGTAVGVTHIYLRDRTAGTTVLVSQSSASVAGNGNSIQAAVSADGRYVAFSSDATNLVPTDTNGLRDVFLRDTTGGTTIRVSVPNLADQGTLGTQTVGNAAGGASRAPSLSSDGTYVAFSSEATNLVLNDTNNVSDVFVFNRVTQSVLRVSRANNGGPNANGQGLDPSGAPFNVGSFNPSISSTGRYVTYASLDSNLTSGDSVGEYGAQAAATVSGGIVTGIAVTNPGGGVPFSSTSVSFGTTQGVTAAYYTTVPNVTISGGGGAGATATATLSAGTVGYITGFTITNAGSGYTSAPTVAIAASYNQSLNIYVYDRDVSGSGTFDTTANINASMVSVNKFGYQTIRIINTQSTAASDIYPVISGDGRWVAMPSDAETNVGLSTTTTNLLSIDANGARDVFLHDRRINTLPNTTTPPSVTITSPGTGTQTLVNTAVSVTASATTTIGTVANVQFFVNGTNIGTSSSFPYSAVWTPAATGTYTLTALVTDSFGNQGVSSNITVTVIAAPSVGITNPVAGSLLTVNAATTVNATAAASSPGATITSVQFFANGVSLGTDTTAPYSVTWTPTSAGSFSLTAVATDSNNTRTTSAAVAVTAGAAPVVAITSPAAGTINVNTPQTITAVATSPSGNVTSVQFFANGTSLGVVTTFPYTVTWTPTAPGSYSLTAAATDNIGTITTSAAVPITVTSGSAPTVSITAPTNGGSVAVGSTAAVTASATATSGTIASVQFFANGTSLGTVTNSPYTVNWNPTSTGTYSLTALAIDTLGNRTTSSAVSVTVASNQSPVVSITAPTSGSTVGVGVSTSITASAVDNDGTIASVQFFANTTSLGTKTTAPYTVTFSSAIAGTYSLTAVATDNLGATTTSAIVTLNVSGGNAPTVAVTAPTTGSTVAVNNPQIVSATASATVGAIASVQFFVSTGGGTASSLGTDTTFPYSATWSPTAVGTYSLTALATDTLGNQTVSSAATITVASGSAPVVTIVNPNSGGTYQAGKEILFDATASDADGTITKVELLANNVIVATDTNSPYFTNWTPDSPGTYTLIARATDNSGNITNSAPITITVTQNTPPVINLLSPANGTSFTAGTPVVFFATATDSNGTINNVRFLANGTLIGAAVTTAPYTQTWTPTVPGSYTITAIAVDNDLNAATSPTRTVSILPAVGVLPSVTITSPTATSAVTTVSTTTITAGVSDADGSVVSVAFYDNGILLGTATSAPFTFSWMPGTAGMHRLVAVATDNSGNIVSSAPVDLNVTAATSPTAPTVSITSPAAGFSLFASTSTVISASAADPDGTVASVQFFANGASLGTDTTFPYTISWTPVATGSYTLTAIATDDAGNKTTSTAVVVTVAGASPPAIAISSPANGSSLTANTTQLITATTTAAVGSIASVQFFANGTSIGVTTAFPYVTSWTPTSPGSYQLTAVATDSFGAQTTSAAVTVSVTAGSSSLPFVYLTSPGTGNTIASGSSALLSASAGDPDGSVTAVEFYAGSQLIGAKTTAPYFVVWTPSTVGTYSITAIVTDNAGNRVTSTASSITVAAASGQLPATALTFNNPSIDATSTTTPNPFVPVNVSFGSKLVFSAAALDPDGSISRVRFFVNGATLATLTAAPYYTVYQLNTLGDVVVTALVTDNAGNSVYTQPILINSIPSLVASQTQVTLTSPANGATFTTGGQILFSATHNFGNVTPPKIDFYVNGSLFTTVTTATSSSASAPYQAILGLTLAGTYDIQAVGRQGTITTVSNTSRITVVSNTAPTVSITSPTASSSYGVGTPLSISASASDVDGTVASVQFFVNGSALATVSTSPFVTAWNPAVAGNYTLTAVATDNAGNQAISSTVAVVIRNNLPPSVSLTSPANSSTVLAGTPVVLGAVAADADGTISNVRFLANGNLIGTASGVPYTATWIPTAGGTYSLIAQATDSSGNVTSSSALTLTVAGNTPPSVAISAPATGNSVRVGTSVTVTAAASDTDGIVTSVQFFANGVSLGTDTTSPFTASWTPQSEGLYRLTAVATDNSGAITTSAITTVLAVSNTASAGDTVYSGTYQGAGETGNFALINMRGTSATLIAYSTTGTPKTYFYSGISVDVSGGFSKTDTAGKTVITGTATESGVSGTFDGTRLFFIGLNLSLTPSNSAVASGYYSGNLSGNFNSTISAIVGANGAIYVYVTNGSFVDAGSSTVNAAGSFSITTANGNRITGKADPTTGFLTGSLSGGNGGTFTGALSTGAVFSDGTLRNLSTRGQVGTGGNVLIAGFYVNGTAPKQILIRAIGPTLANYGVSGALVDPVLQLYNGNGSLLTSNDNWGGNAAIATASGSSGAFALPASSADACLLVTLNPGLYSAQVSGNGGGTGIALVEVYDVDAAVAFTPFKVTNISTRGQVGSTAERYLFAGFYIGGSSPKRVLIRAVGPTLGSDYGVAGALADPILRLQQGSTVVRENDNWETGNDAALVTDAATRLGAFPLRSGSKDAVILMSLPPGLYSAQVGGVNNTTGVALVEVYEVP